jgi:FkbM family methyltransferase
MLPSAIFGLIQKLRALGYRPPEEMAVWKAAFEELQKGLTGSDELAVREKLVLRIDQESRQPFEWFCWRSPEMVSELDLFIKRCTGAATFADVGANHGIFSLVFLKLNPEGKVISIDPSPIADRIRLNNRKLNGMDANLLSYQVASGARKGTVKMHFNWHHLEVSSDSANQAGDVEIAVSPLDELCADAHISPEIIKIDVEGFELDVLQGAEQSLAKARLLFLEIHPERLDELGVLQSAIFDWLNTRGWKIETLHGDRLSFAQFNDKIHTFWTVCERQS